MKNNIFRTNPEYVLLKREIFRRLLMVMGAAIAALLLLLVGTNGRVADAIVWVLQRVFGLGYDTALAVYQRVFRNNIEFIILATLTLFVVIFFRVLLLRLTNYFDALMTGVEQLASGARTEFKFPPEMQFAQVKFARIQSEMRERERQASEAEQRKNDLVMYLAHDIKTPMTSVIGYLSLLDEAGDMPLEQRAKYTHITLEKAIRLERLIDEFFEITRYNLSTILLEKERIDLPYMLAQLADEFYPLVAPDQKRIEVDAPEELQVYADPARLARVFNNILKNAVAYGEPESLISISATATGGWAHISFANTGRRIPQEKLDRIFDKFYRLDDARSTNTGGAGLGLAIAREIIEQHGGRIEAQSTGEGMVFTVLLPLH